jgi:hypothetical protein
MSKKNEVRTIIHELLLEKPETRDNDMYLVTAIWFRQLKAKGYDPKTMSGLELLTMIKNYKQNGLILFETIRRQRCLLQEMHPELRGELYEKRHATQEEVKQDIRDFKQESVFGSFSDQPKLF